MRRPNHPAIHAEWRRGWPVVAGALVGIGAGPGLFQNLSSLFIPGLVAEFGWTRGEIATASGLGLLGGVAAPFLGRLADRYGARPLVVGCMLLLGLAYLGLAHMSGALWEYHLLVLCLALGVPGTSSVVYGRLIAAAFSTHRGLALGVATSGLPLATLLIPPVLGAVIAQHGWRGGFLALAVFASLVALPLALLALRRAARQPPPAPSSPTPSSPVASSPAAHGTTAAAARRDTRFWRLALTGFCTNFATIGFVTQLVPFGIDHGLPVRDAAALLISFGASQIVARLTIGTLVDRRSPRHVAAVVALVSAIGFAMLQVAAPGFALLVVAVFLAGLMNGAENDLLPFFAARLFGTRAYGEIYGTLVLVALAGTGAGVIGFGRLHDAFHGDAVALAAAAVALLAAALLFLSLDERALPHDGA